MQKHLDVRTTRMEEAQEQINNIEDKIIEKKLKRREKKNTGP